MVKANNLLKLKEYLESYDFTSVKPIRLPNLWINSNSKRNGFSKVIEGKNLLDSINIILKNSNEELDYLESLNNIEKDKKWINKAHIYSLFIRPTFSTIEKGKIKNGTFLRAINYLPTLKEMGINLIYLLPIFKHSSYHKKGDFGSPYSALNFYSLDDNLYDKTCNNPLTLNEQFKAFVEACHILGMRVSIDFVPRTNARDSSLINNHPDWFYWIKTNELENYRTPHVEGLANFTTPTKDCAEQLYSSKYVQEFISKFSIDPKNIDPNKWDKVCKMKGNLLENIETYFGLTTAPAFSDTINDPQPSWDDVTYFRMYLDNPISSKPYVDKNINPYLLFDVAKSSLNPGNKPNKKLWEYIANVIPHYQKEFGIDCARIDMGHALPIKLNKMMIQEARKNDPYFGFIAEEMFIHNSAHHKEMKYDAIVGNSFLMIHELYNYKIQEFAYSSKYSSLPVFAASETHDTPRVASRLNGPELNKFLTSACMFIPKGIPFLNCGQEIHEITPINTGLGVSTVFDKHLDEFHPLFGKLPLFDKFYFNYRNEFNVSFIENYIRANKVREKFYRFIKDNDSFIQLSNQYDTFLHYGFFKKNEALIVIGNTNPNRWYNYLYDTNYLISLYGENFKIKQVFSTRYNEELPVDIYLKDLTFSPLELKIIHIKKR
ncbi:MAG: maltodextrin glycosyltransferase [Bacilli bacterium]|nr:maltodextrin glycosyltransferase [Bacilli bacterium]